MPSALQVVSGQECFPYPNPVGSGKGPKSLHPSFAAGQITGGVVERHVSGQTTFLYEPEKGGIEAIS